MKHPGRTKSRRGAQNTRTSALPRCFSPLVQVRPRDQAMRQNCRLVLPLRRNLRLPLTTGKRGKSMRYTRQLVFFAVFTVLAAPLAARSQTTNSICDKIAKLDSDVHEYLQPRWQDEELTPVDHRVLQQGTKAVPLLITCLSDERKTMVNGALWAEPTVGMVAFSMLWDLFTGCDGYDENGYGVSCRNTIKGVITWDDLCNEGPPDGILPCGAGWENHLKKYGRKSIQQSWQKAWTENKDRIYWDATGKCFRIKKTP